MHWRREKNLINIDFVPAKWHQYIRPFKDLGLFGATKQAVLMCGVILSHVHRGKLSVRVCFGVVEKLAFKVLLGTTFIENFFKGILREDGCILPIHSTTVPILGYVADQDESLNAVAEKGREIEKKNVPCENCQRPTD